MTSKAPHIILNPTSGGGLGKKLWPKMNECLERFFKHHNLHETKSSGDAEKMAFEACEQGANLIVACGGDGTIHEIVNGIMKSPHHKNVTLGFLNAGTGGDFIKSLKIPPSIQEQANILFHHKTDAIDVGKITFDHDHKSSKQKEPRYFINIADYGIGGLVVEKLMNRRKLEGQSFLGRKISYLKSTLQSYLEWKSCDVEVTTEKETFVVKKANSIVIANGEYFGGGMPIAQGARLDDGLFDVICMSDEPLFLKPPLVPLKLAALYTGNIHLFPYTKRFLCKKISLRFVEPQEPLTRVLDIDGEPTGHLPVSFSLMPRALNVIVP